MNMTLGKGFLILAAVAMPAASLDGEERLKVLAVVAHPDDEYAFSATTTGSRGNWAELWIKW
jgi:hypothetical protein